jgi:branched-chain amino acid aminotransferase
MLVQDNRIRLEDYHWERLRAGLHSLQILSPAHFFAELKAALWQTVRKNGHEALCRVRLQVWPGSGGYFDSDPFKAEYCIETFSLTPDQISLNENGLVIGVAEGITKSSDALSHIKSSNALHYALAARQAKSKHWNDALLLNQAGRIADSTIANFFWVTEEGIFTPPVSDGPVAGVFRQFLLRQLPLIGYAIQEQSTAPEHLTSACALFLTNAIRGIRWVQGCGHMNFSRGLVAELSKKVLRSL